MTLAATSSVRRPPMSRGADVVRGTAATSPELAVSLERAPPASAPR